MSDERQHEETPRAGLSAVLTVLVPLLAGAAAAIFLLVGYGVKVFDAHSKFAQDMVAGGWLFGGFTAVSILFGAAGLLITALRNPSGVSEEGSQTVPARDRPHPPGRAAHRTMDFASFVAGQRRAHLREEWSAILAGDPGNGIVLSPRRRMLYALGFLWAALRMRLRDLVAPLWLPVDWLLSTESRANVVITTAVGTQVVYIQHEDSLHTLFTEGWGWCAGCGIALRLLIGWLRRLRGIELASARGNTGDR
ncbi:hypothetical protein ACF063_27135 [Streptomyces chartreusis]|uniref:hypothetical protein n=1 Tax=Streptomyces chartreusis TaxID=1969 RepID=UPI0036F4C150